MAAFRRRVLVKYQLAAPSVHRYRGFSTASSHASRPSWLPHVIPAYERVFTPVKQLPLGQRIHRLISVPRILLKFRITHQLRAKMHEKPFAWRTVARLRNVIAFCGLGYALKSVSRLFATGSTAKSEVESYQETVRVGFASVVTSLEGIKSSVTEGCWNIARSVEGRRGSGGDTSP